MENHATETKEFGPSFQDHPLDTGEASNAEAIPIYQTDERMPNADSGF